MTGIWVWNMLEKSPSIGIVQFGQLVGELPVRIKAYLAFDKSGELKVATDGQTFFCRFLIRNVQKANKKIFRSIGE